jgi:hypothetical protein
LLALGCHAACHAAGAPVARIPLSAAGGDAALSTELADTLGWILATHDNAGAPFVIVDKRTARLQVHDAAGRLLGSTPVLLGMARSDRIVPGTEDRPLSQIRPQERVTPAGRYQARRGRNQGGEEVIWVDYDAGISMHRVRAVSASEHRLERLLSATPLDNRISYGCINVPIAFYDAILRGAASQAAVVYVLPETAPAAQWFGFGRR